MRICRFNDGRLGLADDAGVLDVSGFLDPAPVHRWGCPWADPVMSALPDLARYARETTGLERLGWESVRLHSPVPRPSKIIGAPVNYHAHLEEARADHALHQGARVHPIDEIGLFLKATSAMAGPDAAIALTQPSRRSDHEAEVVLVIGREARDVPADAAGPYIAGYTLGLDLSVRGKEDRSMRKSPDGYAVVGPWVVSADEIPDPGAIEFELLVNGLRRQRGSTAALIRGMGELVEMASRFYTLHPGDLIMTGTPAGVAALAPGDELVLSSPQLGELRVRIA